MVTRFLCTIFEHGNRFTIVRLITSSSSSFNRSPHRIYFFARVFDLFFLSKVLRPPHQHPLALTQIHVEQWRAMKTEHEEECDEDEKNA